MKRRVEIESPGGVSTQSDSSVDATSATPMISPLSFSGKSNGNGNGHGRGFSKVGEAVGGTAAVICCFPCAVINLVVLAVYKVPIGLWKRAWNRKKRKQRRRLLSKKNKNSASFDEFDWRLKKNVGLGLILSSDDEEEEERENDRLELEEEMYGQFYRGFWRSPSQKGD